MEAVDPATTGGISWLVIIGAIVAIGVIATLVTRKKK